MIRSLLVVTVALWAFWTYQLPKVDVPYVPDWMIPGASCTVEPAMEPGGIRQAVSDAGSALRYATTEPPPSYGEMRDRMAGWVTGTGELAGTFRAAFQGRPYVPPAQQVVAPPAPAVPAAPSSGVALAARAAASAGWTDRDLVMAVAVAGAESGFDPAAANPTSSARGLWQVMTSVHAAKIGSDNILDPYVNARVAYAIWTEAGGLWSPWTVAGSGAYRAWLDEAEAAVAALPGSGVVQAGYTPPADCEPGVIPAGMPAGECPAPEGLLTPETVRLCRIVAPAFNVTTVYGWGLRGNATEHDDGRALDFMVYDDQAKGQAIAEYVQANAEELDVLYIVWRQQIWSVARADEGWRAMEDRGGATANHMDHPHVSLEPSSGGAV